MNKKNILIGLLIILAILAGLFVLNKTGKLKLGSLGRKEKANLPPAPKYTKTDLPTDKLPEVFPKDIIQEKNAVILENFEADLESGEKQFTVKYTTDKKPAEVLDLYMAYFRKEKWAVSAIARDFPAILVTANKSPKEQLIVTARMQSGGVQSLVELVLMIKK